MLREFRTPLHSMANYSLTNHSPSNFRHLARPPKALALAALYLPPQTPEPKLTREDDLDPPTSSARETLGWIRAKSQTRIRVDDASAPTFQTEQVHTIRARPSLFAHCIPINEGHGQCLLPMALVVAAYRWPNDQRTDYRSPNDTNDCIPITKRNDTTKRNDGILPDKRPDPHLPKRHTIAETKRIDKQPSHSPGIASPPHRRRHTHAGRSINVQPIRTSAGLALLPRRHHPTLASRQSELNSHSSLAHVGRRCDTDSH